MELFYREYGSGQPLVILHGLFGSADNWMTQAKMLAEKYRVFTVDQRNHGLSPHSQEHDYALMANDLQEFITKHHLSPAIVVGHSMGGKTAMNFALMHPEMVKALVVVDIMPKPYPIHHDKIIDGLKALPLDALKSRNEADEKLAAYVPEADVRQFLLKNLNRKAEGGFSWKINLPVLAQNIGPIVGGLVTTGSYAGPTLFMVGERSNYYAPGDEETLGKHFPNFTLTTLATGHWMQAEKPKEFVETVQGFLGNG